jgi:chemotaxis protein MotB
MSGSVNAKRPIIVRRRKEEHEAHGGQWKVAYADFVTAMMAFFLIMWLLSVTNEKERASIAKYFTTPSVFDLPAGNGVLTGGKSVMGGSEGTTQALVQPKPRNAEAMAVQPSAKQGDAGHDRIDQQRFEALRAELARLMADGMLKTLASNMLVETTPLGLRLQIFDNDGKAMFSPGSLQPTPRLTAILAVVAQVLATVRNPVIITGHTDAQPLDRPNFSNWELSAGRANATRRELEADGLPAERFQMIEGRAATDPLLPATPLDPRNRRIAVTILRSDVAATLTAPPPDGPAAP